VYTAPFQTLRALPGMRERTVAISGLSKTFSLTGWRIGWLTGPEALVERVRGVHQYVTFAAPTPLQHAAAVALGAGDDYYEGLRQAFAVRRTLLGDALVGIGFDVYWPEGAYFLCAGYGRLFTEDDTTVCRRLTKEIGVAAIPPSAFYADRAAQPYVRFTFAKQESTLQAAIARLQKLVAR